ncbi:MAG: NAD(P)/FAD-dependent oxidoreductase [archaeon]
MHISIVGAGPAGLYLAKQLKDFDVEILEEHPKVGEPVQCTGILSKTIEQFVKIPEEIILNKIRGARLFSPSGEMIEVKQSEVKAYIVDRAKFDQHLAEDVDVKFNTRVSEIPKSDYVIGADGPSSEIARLAGFPPLEDVVVGVQYVIKNPGYDEDFVEAYAGSEVAPNFFAWIVPAGDNLRVGLATNKSPVAYLDKFVKKKFSSPEILQKNAGQIPLKWRSSFVKDNVALLGDAAGQVKATTGGGVYMGFLSAEILAEAIKNNNLQGYEENWKIEALPELKLNHKIHEIYKKLQDSEIDNITKLVKSANLNEVIAEYGNTEKPSILVKHLLKNPRALKLLPYLRHIL